jgi:hypothetical protein
MVSHTWWVLALVGLVAWWLLLVWVCQVLSRSVTSRDVTRRSRRPRSTPSSLDLATADAREWFWRTAARATWAAGLRRLSGRYTRRAEVLEKRRHRRAETVGQRAVRDRAWASYLSTQGSSPSSVNLPPSAPRPAPTLPWISPDMSPTGPEEDTRQWERTLPWGTPSPLLTREGMGKPYPFVPLAEQPPSSGSAYRSPPRAPRRPPPPVTSLPRGPRRSAQ